MNGLALCAGGGGIEMGLHLVMPEFYRTVCVVERQAYAASCIVDWMEKTGLGACPVWDDVATFDPLPWCGVVDIVTAGYPCQPFSLAGKRNGENDPRHLWPHIRRIIRGVMPPVVFCENVDAHLANGYPTVKNDLAELGYRIAEGIYSAEEVGAPHIRKRLFILGVLADTQRGTGNSRSERFGWQTGADADRRCAHAAMGNADSTGLPEGELERRCIDNAIACWPWPAGRDCEQFPWEAPRIIKPDLGGTIDGVGTRNEQLYLLGNGVVPMAAALAFVALWEKLKSKYPGDTLYEK